MATIDDSLTEVARGKVHTVTAADVTAGSIAIDFKRALTVVIVQVRTAAGVVKAWDGAVTWTAAGVVTVNNAGSTDWADTDTISVLTHSIVI